MPHAVVGPALFYCTTRDDTEFPTCPFSGGTHSAREHATFHARAAEHRSACAPLVPYLPLSSMLTDVARDIAFLQKKFACKGGERASTTRMYRISGNM